MPGIGCLPPGRRYKRLSKDLCIRPYSPPNVPPGACAGQRLPAPRQALKTSQPIAAYGLYGKTIANLEFRKKRPPRQAAARLSYYAEVFNKLKHMGFMARPSPMWNIEKNARPGRRLPGSVNMQKSFHVPPSPSRPPPVASSRAMIRSARITASRSRASRCAVRVPSVVPVAA